MSNELEVALKERDSRIEDLERRIRYCEAVASQYKSMFEQLESKLKAFSDRQGNIQQVYDYLTRVGSSIAIKTPHKRKFLNRMSRSLPASDQKTLELMKKFKFKAGDEVYYADEHNNRITYHLVQAVDIIDEHPRYCISDIFGYVDESKLFKSEEEAEWQLNEWKRPW
jgi:tRNA/tmRNA/rRNA uracil-C5-methylase (TrmA/RlmC/RlmD family)